MDANDSAWLGMKGRAKQAEWQFGDAITVLRRAPAIRRDNSAVQIDLASACCERATATEEPADSESAIKILNEELLRRSDDSLALFNRAIIYERGSRDVDAVHDWEAFLKQNPDSVWSAEARRTLGALRKKASPAH